MKTKTLLSFLAVGLVLNALGQYTHELTYTAIDSTAYVQLDSIKVMNRTQGGDTVLYWPDTVLSIYYVGIHETPDLPNEFKVFQNYPNPVIDQTTVSLYVPQNDKVSIIVTDILGRVIVQSERVLDKGKHSFRLTSGSVNLYFVTAMWQGQSSSIKILQSGFHSGVASTIKYTGSKAFSPQLKATKDIQDFYFNPGDTLLYISYADGLQSGMLDSPEESTTFTFQFATNIPCPGTPTVEYEGQVYNTIQILSQCWLKENLNVGTMISDVEEMTDNDTIEKYCYNNELDSCTKYGGLYQWNEMMQYTTQQDAQGICPLGWHLPTDEEWKLLEGAVDSQYGIGNLEWDSEGYRGFDAGINLRTTIGWYWGESGTDLYGFSALPGGARGELAGFYYVGEIGYLWTSTEFIHSWGRYLVHSFPKVTRLLGLESYGFSVRCLRD